MSERQKNDPVLTPILEAQVANLRQRNGTALGREAVDEIRGIIRMLSGEKLDYETVARLEGIRNRYYPGWNGDHFSRLLDDSGCAENSRPSDFNAHVQSRKLSTGSLHWEELEDLQGIVCMLSGQPLDPNQKQRLQQIKKTHYTNWTQSDFIALLKKLGKKS